MFQTHQAAEVCWLKSKFLVSKNCHLPAMESSKVYLANNASQIFDSPQTMLSVAGLLLILTFFHV